MKDFDGLGSGLNDSLAVVINDKGAVVDNRVCLFL